MIRSAILGASGYVGGELLRLLARHPEIEATRLFGDSKAGQKLVAPLTAMVETLQPRPEDVHSLGGGAAVIEALRSGAADVGSIGEAPVPIAVDSGVTDLATIGLQANPGTSGLGRYDVE